jgi:hypothetical protein
LVAIREEKKLPVLPFGHDMRYQDFADETAWR